MLNYEVRKEYMVTLFYNTAYWAQILPLYYITYFFNISSYIIHKYSPENYTPKHLPYDNGILTRDYWLCGPKGEPLCQDGHELVETVVTI